MPHSNTEASGKRVLMIVNTFAPHDPRVIFSATSLARMGYDVMLVGSARLKDEVVNVRHYVDGVNVFIVPVMRDNHPGAILRELWHMLWADPGLRTRATPNFQSTLLSVILFNLWIIRLAVGRRFDVVHCHDASPLPGAWIAARLCGAKLVYDVHEDVPTMYTGRKGEIVSQMERFFLPRTAGVVSAGIRLAPILRERGASRVEIIGNWKRLEDYNIPQPRIDAVRHQLNIAPTDLVLLYIGTMDPTRELLPLLEAVRMTENVRLIIGGRGLLQPDVEAAAADCERIHWLGWVDLPDIPLYTHVADVVYYCRTRSEFQEKNWIAPAANKVFEAFAAGRPLLITRGVNEISDIVEESGVGILMDDITAESLVQVFAQLRDTTIREDLSEKALAARDQYNWSIAEARLRTLYGDLTRD